MISFTEANALLRYDSHTGKLFWRVDRTAGVKAGDEAGSLRRGYIGVKVMGTRHEAHRIAWLLAHHHWPEQDIDHINGVPADNRLSNLREATDGQNLANAKLHRDSTTGLKGVSLYRRNGKFVAQIQVRGRKKTLGYFDTPKEAHAAYAAAAKLHFGEFARTA